MSDHGVQGFHLSMLIQRWGKLVLRKHRALAVPSGLVHHLVVKSSCTASGSIGDEQNVSAFLKSSLGKLFPPQKVETKDNEKNTPNIEF